MAESLLKHTNYNFPNLVKISPHTEIVKCLLTTNKINTDIDEHHNKECHTHDDKQQSYDIIQKCSIEEQLTSQ